MVCVIRSSWFLGLQTLLVCCAAPSPVRPQKTLPEPPNAPPIDCGDVTPSNTHDGLVHLHFDRQVFGMMPVLCGPVVVNSGGFEFQGYLQKRLAREPGQGSCDVMSIDVIVARDITMWLEGVWQSGSDGEGQFVVWAEDTYPPERTATLVLEQAIFGYVCGDREYQGWYDGCCGDSEFCGLEAEVAERCLEFSRVPLGTGPRRTR